MARIHKSVIDVSAEFFMSMRRNVYCTPKSFLAFIDMYRDLYKEKFDNIDREEQNVNNGLETIKAASKQIEELRVVINKQRETVDELLKGIKEKAAVIKEDTDKAKKKEEEVTRDATEIEANKVKVEHEKQIAEEKLNESKPILEEALEALGKIQAKELDEISKYPPDKLNYSIKCCFDCVAMLLSYPVKSIEIAEVEVKKGRKEIFYKDSYDLTSKSILKNSNRLLQMMKEFAAEDKRDKLTDGSVELVEA